ncbi:DUF4062 domain-containing protein [bacterium]|nr:DUF4062 domain-containing protein [bacterium]MCI0603934.1 DUF4062 domain-containing protein [bacterium]
MSDQTTVFVSSSWADLEVHRRAVLQALAQLKKHVEAMEYFGASSDSPLETCLKAIEKSTVYIGMIGTRYGSAATKDGISYTHAEYLHAKALSKKILVYMMDEERHPVLPKYVDTGEAAVRLMNFKQELTASHVCKVFVSADNLAGQVAIDLIRLLEDMGQHIRKALEQTGFRRFLVNAGFDVSGSDLQLNLTPVLDERGSGTLKFSSGDLDSLMAAGFLIEQMRKGDFELLKQFISFKPEVWRHLAILLPHESLNERALSQIIRTCKSSLELRTFIRIAGAARATGCAEEICKRLFDAQNHQRSIQEYGVQVTPFNEVVKEALMAMPGVDDVIVKYMTLAKSNKRWQAKQILKAVLTARGRNRPV